MNMLQTKKEELKKQGKKGFTLMELLIVVAIIAVLVAIAIPLFTNQLEKARDATSVANIRSAYAQAQTAYLTESDDKANGVVYDKTAGTVTVYNVTIKSQAATPAWSGEADDLPKELANIKAKDPGKAGYYPITFTYVNGALSKAELGTMSADPVAVPTA